MTPRERAEAIVREWAPEHESCFADLISVIEAAIIADRRALLTGDDIDFALDAARREAIEACAKIANDVESEHSSPYAKTAARQIQQRIAAIRNQL